MKISVQNVMNPFPKTKPPKICDFFQEKRIILINFSFNFNFPHFAPLKKRWSKLVKLMKVCSHLVLGTLVLSPLTNTRLTI
jgi:hypothetical protein